MADSQAQAVTSPKSAVNASSPASPKSAFSPRSVAEAAGGEEVLLEVDYVSFSARSFKPEVTDPVHYRTEQTTTPRLTSSCMSSAPCLHCRWV